MKACYAEPIDIDSELSRLDPQNSIESLLGSLGITQLFSAREGAHYPVGEIDRRIMTSQLDGFSYFLILVEHDYNERSFLAHPGVIITPEADKDEAECVFLMSAEYDPVRKIFKVDLQTIKRCAKEKRGLGRKQKKKFSTSSVKETMHKFIPAGTQNLRIVFLDRGDQETIYYTEEKPPDLWDYHGELGMR